MSTRSRIGLLLPDGKSSQSRQVRSIYCHFDGYPSWVGRHLQDYWQESIRPLLDGGDVSSLGEVMGRDEGTGAFDRRYLLKPGDERKTWTVFYRRDRGSRGVDAVTHPRNVWPDSGWEYLYLWTGKAWQVRARYGITAECSYRWTPLVKVLAREEKTNGAR